MPSWLDAVMTVRAVAHVTALAAVAVHVNRESRVEALSRVSAVPVG